MYYYNNYCHCKYNTIHPGHTRLVNIGKNYFLLSLADILHLIILKSIFIFKILFQFYSGLLLNICLLFNSIRLSGYSYRFETFILFSFFLFRLRFFWFYPPESFFQEMYLSEDCICIFYTGPFLFDVCPVSSNCFLLPHPSNRFLLLQSPPPPLSFLYDRPIR